MPDITQILEMLPEIVNTAQIIAYVLFALFFGSLALKGNRKRISFPLRILFSLGIGFAIMIASIVFSEIIPFMKGDIIRIFQIDIFVYGLIISVIFALGFYLITRGSERPGYKKTIEKLGRKIEFLEGLLEKHGVEPISEKVVKNTAEHMVSGYKAVKANLVKGTWEVFLEKGKKRARVYLDSYDGEVKEIDTGRSSPDPLRIVGVVMIIAILGFSAFNFRGFPNLMDDIANLLGMGDIFGEDENLPEGCVSASRLALKYNPDLPEYRNENVRQLIENESGRSIGWMYRVSYGGKEYILAIDSGFENICSSLETLFCNCMKIPEV